MKRIKESICELSPETECDAIHKAFAKRRDMQGQNMSFNTIDKYNKMYAFSEDYTNDTGATFRINGSRDGEFWVEIKVGQYSTRIIKDPHCGNYKFVDNKQAYLPDTTWGYAIDNLKAGDRAKLSKMTEIVNRLNGTDEQYLKESKKNMKKILKEEEYNPYDKLAELENYAKVNFKALTYVPFEAEDYDGIAKFFIENNLPISAIKKYPYLSKIYDIENLSNAIERYKKYLHDEEMDDKWSKMMAGAEEDMADMGMDDDSLCESKKNIKRKIVIKESQLRSIIKESLLSLIKEENDEEDPRRFQKMVEYYANEYPYAEWLKDNTDVFDVAKENGIDMNVLLYPGGKDVFGRAIINCGGNSIKFRQLIQPAIDYFVRYYSQDENNAEQANAAYEIADRVLNVDDYFIFIEDYDKNDYPEYDDRADYEDRM